MGPAGGGRLSGWAHGLVGGVAFGGARSRNFLRLVPHFAAVRSGAARAAYCAGRAGSVGQRTQVSGQRRQAGGAMGGGAAVLQRCQEWRAEIRGIARYGGGAECADSGPLSNGRGERRAAQYVGAATENRREAGLVELAEFPQRALGSGRFGVLGRGAGFARRWAGARRIPEWRCHSW